MKIVGADLSISATGIAQRDGSVITVGGKPSLGDDRLIIIEDALIQALGLEDADRCGGCEHDWDIHDADGRCWYTVARGVEGSNLVCPCKTTRPEDSRADLLVVEGSVARSQTAYISGQLHGIVKRLCIRHGMPFVFVPPATLKAYATGKGNGDKTQMAIAALKRAGAEFRDDNQCDAAWLRWAALDHYGLAEFSMPQAQRDRLAKVSWPNNGALTSP
jgi:hypothetical protein